jgi:small-conductance mechanosensitive channel
MSTPIDERPEPTYSYSQQDYGLVRPSQEQRRSAERRSIERPRLPSYNINHQQNRNFSHDKSSDEEGTVVGEQVEEQGVNVGSSTNVNETAQPRRARAGSHLTVQTEYDGDPIHSIRSPSTTREQENRLNDDLKMLQIERQVSEQAEEDALSRSKSRDTEGMQSKSRKRDEHVDEFDIATNPVHEKTQVYKPVEHPTTGFSKFIKKLHKSNWVIRYITYITPLTLILLIPLLLGALVFKKATVGGVHLIWFMIWLEIVWLTLWAGRILAKCLPWPIGIVSSLFTNNSKKWRDMGKQLELPATLFFWWLAIEVSFLPTMVNHQVPPSKATQGWMKTTNKVLVTIFVAAILNFVEKIIIQLIAISFHLRTYADRIEINKFQIGSLTKLYKFSKEKIQMEDHEFEMPSGNGAGGGSGARTPGQLVNDAAKTTKEAFTKFGDIAGKVAGDFTGRQTVKSSHHPHQVVLTLLHTTAGAQVLARRLYRTFAREETETVHSDDLRHAFENDEEADAAFSMFDKDMNGDISMEELEAVCVEIGRERKSITASLKDLDSVVSKLDDVLMFFIFVITVLVFISLISTSAAGVLTSAGSTVLGLSWLFSVTAQEFLQSIIFVFVKHPFDVGDRVGIYGNTGALGRGDDYFVKEISLLYTEFKKMEGHVVQAPNSYLNTLFILNQRRSGGLAEAVSITIKFGTTLDQIDGLRTKLLEFVQAEKREYQGNILTELRDIVEVHSMNLNVVFFYKSNWQNEGLRLARRNKFICAMMVAMQELRIEGPYMRFPGQKQSFPVYLQNVPHVQRPDMGHSGHPDQPGGLTREEIEEHKREAQPGEEEDGLRDPPFVAPIPGQEETTGSLPRSASRMRSGSILKGARQRGESLSAMNKRVDFSLGAQSIASGDPFGADLYEDRRPKVPIRVTEASQKRQRAASRASQDSASRARKSQDAPGARSTSTEMPFGPGNLARRSTDTAGRWRSPNGGTVHRNRFFGRSRPGTGDEDGLMESGMIMADIPENPSTAGSGTLDGSVSTAAATTPCQRVQQQIQQQRLDPRTGMVSPAAWRLESDEGNLRPPPAAAGGGISPRASGALGDDGVPEGFRAPMRARTDLR